jgi:diamine N-acetyltransferase
MPSITEAPSSSSDISLREVSRDTVRVICDLSVSKSQEQFVAPNSVSIAEAYFTKEAWFRAVYAGETPVGFVMLWENPTEGKHFLWRFMIDEKYQGRGYGKRALGLVIQHVKQNPKAQEIGLSYREGGGSPKSFYERIGFRDTGEMVDGEHEMKLTLYSNRSDSASRPV